MSVTLTVIVLLLIFLIINTFIGKTEKFTVENSTLDSNALDRVDDMADKLDNLVEQEQETRTFCKLLRHDSSNREQLEKVRE